MKQQPRHIFLCGFMGCGKSTQGKKLAGLLRQTFTDLDQYIQKKEDKTIQFIFENEGEEHFRQLETKHLRELIKEKSDSVIALGGGTVCFNNNLELVKKNGILVYIQMPAPALAERLLRSKQKRPLLENILPEKLADFIEEKLRERNEYYNQAHLVVQGIDLNHLQLQQQIIDYKEKK